MSVTKLLLTLAAWSLNATVSAQSIPAANLTQNTAITVQNVTSATACTVGVGTGIPPVTTSATASFTYTSGSSTGSATGNGSTVWTVICNGNQPVTFTASAGAGNNANGTTRRALKAGTTPEHISYQLTQMNAMPSPGNIFDSTVPVFGGSNMVRSTSGGAVYNAGTFNYIVEVPAGQLNQTAGTYTDSVAITVTF